MPPRKILHILHAFSHGGLENGIVNIINGSPPELDHELCLITTAGEFVNRLKKPVRCYELRKQPGNSMGVILEICRVIRNSRADVIHTRNWGAFDGILAACLFPGVTVLHGEHGRDLADPLGLNRRRNMLRRLFSPRVRKFTTVSEDLVLWLCEKVRISRDKVVLIRNGVDTARCRPHRNPGLRKELGITDSEFVIGTIGRLDPVKNHAGLIHAFAKLTKETPGARLVIVGDGPERKSLRDLIRELGIIPPPILTGYRSDVERFYGLFDVFVLNSYAEGMSNTLLEAMSSGLPVICTPVGANVEIVNNERGRLIPVSDNEALIAGLRDYMNSQELRLSHGNAGNCFIKDNYSLSQMIQKYVDLYLNGFRG